jgi:hypothetical protein
VSRKDPVNCDSLSQVFARFEQDVAHEHDVVKGEQMMMKQVFELFIKEHLDLARHECLVALCMSCCPQVHHHDE